MDDAIRGVELARLGVCLLRSINFVFPFKYPFQIPCCSPLRSLFVYAPSLSWAVNCSRVA